MNWKLTIWLADMLKEWFCTLFLLRKANIDLSFQMATAIDLAGRDVI